MKILRARNMFFGEVIHYYQKRSTISFDKNYNPISFSTSDWAKPRCLARELFVTW